MSHDYDIAIVGYGPIGELAAIMLGRRGYRVGVFERWAQLYPLPRAVVYDDEIARIFQQEDLLEDVTTISSGVPDHYEWHNRDHEVLLRIDWSAQGPSGRPQAIFFSQPELQGVLDVRARATPGVEVHTGWQLEGLADHGDHVALTVRKGNEAPGHWEPSDETRTVTARYVIGADGANSAVRAHMGVEQEDLGFQFDWLIVDVKPHEDRVWSPMNWQLCDPARPVAVVSGGPGRRRWEFMRLPGESIEELNTEATAWRLLAPFDRTPENSTIERNAVYTFQAKWAKQWRRGRMLLAGDAAHLMPPFAGQGMCSGLRDVANLVWKLDLVLSGRAGDALLDTYGPERTENVRFYINLSVALGQVTCVLDEEVARERDARMVAADGDPAQVLPAGPPPRLGPGIVTDADVAGLLMAQGRVERDGVTGLLDELTAPGFQLLVADATQVSAITAAAADRFAELGGQVFVLDADAPGALRDVDGFYRGWLAEQRAVAVLVRPDCYVYGTATDAGEVAGLVDALLAAISRPAAASPRALQPATA